MTIKNEKGLALVISLMVVTVLLLLATIFIFKAITEKTMADKERQSIQAFYIAEAGSENALSRLDTFINSYLLTEVNNKNPQILIRDVRRYDTDGDGIAFLIDYVEEQGLPLFTRNVEDEAEYDSGDIAFGDGGYRYLIEISDKYPPQLVAADIWDFYFYFQIESRGHVANIQRSIVLNGDFTVRVQRDNFAKYALFTDHHYMPNGVTVWFTDKTNFAGPIHTNDRFSFAFNPSGLFDGTVTQHLSKHRFYNNGYPVLLDADDNTPYDVPTFNNSITRSVDEIVLESSVQKNDLISQAQGSLGSPGSQGIYVPNNGSDLTGGIYVLGNAIIDMSVDSDDNALYTITQGTTTKKVIVDIPNDRTTIETVGGGTEVYAGKPDGVDDLGTIIYVDGEISSLGGQVQRDTEVTVSSENDIVITDNIRYSDYTPSSGTPGTVDYVEPGAEGTSNLFGIVCWGGNVRIGTSAPDNIELHGPIMARNGIFAVDNYNNFSVGPRGTATILGGVITQFYGAFGMFSGATGEQLSGYGRNFVYDSRLLVGKAPPYFPSMKTFIAFTNDLTDKIAWQEGGQ